MLLKNIPTRITLNWKIRGITNSKIYHFNIPLTDHTATSGIMLKELISKYLAVNEKNLQTGMVVLTGKDGYHATYSVSEVMNRNDQAEFLVIPALDNPDGGAFQVFPAADFFSDRAIKALESIRILNIESAE